MYSPVLFKEECVKQLFNTSPPFYGGVGADNLSLVLQIYRARGTVQKKALLKKLHLGSLIHTWTRC